MIYEMKTEYHEGPVILEWGKYSNGRPALEILDAQDGSPIMVATVNIPEVKLREKEIIIKDYSENEGVLKFLQDHGIVGEVKRGIGVGWVFCPVVDVLV